MLRYSGSNSWVNLRRDDRAALHKTKRQTSSLLSHCLCVVQIFLHASWQLCDLMAEMWQRKRKGAQSKSNKGGEEESRSSLLNDADWAFSRRDGDSFWVKATGHSLQFHYPFIDLLIVTEGLMFVISPAAAIWDYEKRFSHSHQRPLDNKRNSGKHTIHFRIIWFRASENASDCMQTTSKLNKLIAAKLGQLGDGLLPTLNWSCWQNYNTRHKGKTS